MSDVSKLLERLALRHTTGFTSGEGDDSYPVQPPVDFYHPTNPASQNALIRVTDAWPDVRNLRLLKLKYVSTNVYKMAKTQSDRFIKALNMLPVGDTVLTRIKRASQAQLLKMASYYLRRDVVAVRWVYRYDEKFGDPRERLDVVFKKAKPLFVHRESQHARKKNLQVG